MVIQVDVGRYRHSPRWTEKKSLLRCLVLRRANIQHKETSSAPTIILKCTIAMIYGYRENKRHKYLLKYLLLLSN